MQLLTVICITEFIFFYFLVCGSWIKFPNNRRLVFWFIPNSLGLKVLLRVSSGLEAFQSRAGSKLSSGSGGEWHDYTIHLYGYSPVMHCRYFYFYEFCFFCTGVTRDRTGALKLCQSQTASEHCWAVNKRCHT